MAAVRSLHVPRGSAPPAAVSVHVPSAPATAQLRQAPLHVVLQQTPSTQWPLTQSVSAAHDWPSTFWPQVPCFWPVGIVQACPAAQSAFELHVSLQAPFTHPKVPHVNGLGG